MLHQTTELTISADTPVQDVVSRLEDIASKARLKWDVSRVTDMTAMFAGKTFFNGDIYHNGMCPA